MSTKIRHITDEEAKVERTEAGLIVPQGTIEKKQRTILKEHAKKLERLSRTMIGEHLVIALLCIECGTAAQVIADPEKGSLLECKCSQRVIR